MLRRSQGEPTTPLDPEIERTLRGVRRLFGNQSQEEEEASLSSSSDESESMAEEPPPPPPPRPPPNPLFQDFGNPEEYELTSGILLPTTDTNFTIHPQYTRMVQNEQFPGVRVRIQ